MRRFILKFFGHWRPEDERQWRADHLNANEWFETASFDELKDYLKSHLKDETSEEDYRGLYGDDEKAIIESKQGWRRAGIETCNGILLMMNNPLKWKAYKAAKEETASEVK